MNNEDEKLGQAFAGVDSIQGYAYTGIGMVPSYDGEWIKRSDIITNIRSVISMMKGLLSSIMKPDPRYTGFKDGTGRKLNEGDMISWLSSGATIRGTVFGDVHRDGRATTKFGPGIPSTFAIVVGDEQHETN